MTVSVGSYASLSGGLLSTEAQQMFGTPMSSPSRLASKSSKGSGMTTVTAEHLDQVGSHYFHTTRRINAPARTKSKRFKNTSFFVDCRLYRNPLNSINWKERLHAHFYPPEHEAEREIWDKGSGWTHSWRLLYRKTPLNKDPDMLETEKWSDDLETQCAHVRDLFQRKQIRYNDDVKTAPPPVLQHGTPVEWFQSIRADGLRGIDWIYDTASDIWFRCTTHIKPIMKYPQFEEDDQRMNCSVFEPSKRKDGKCGLLGRWCNYNSQTMRTQCVEKAENFPETSMPNPPYWDKQQCVYLGDHDERIPRDWRGANASYEVYFL
ncbi:unnamed protein product [Amoebophrya sp. A120]|nr:unnamed protein product [Amoebophrya sp. A120]|eukprot:GSA120T00019814001.1